MKIVIHGWAHANRASVVDFWLNLWLALVVVAPTGRSPHWSGHCSMGSRFPLTVNAATICVRLRRVSSIPSSCYLIFFEQLFIVDGSFPTGTVVSHQIEVKILALIPILVLQKVCFKTKWKNTQEQIQRSQ